MKLIVQIPCLDEEKTLPETLRAIPRSVAGFDSVEVLIVDDGSSDRTAEVARANGADHVVRFTRTKGLAQGFMAGLDACLRLGADVIVNTDADNQYQGRDIPKLIAPILAGRADMVIGDRPIDHIPDFTPLKKRLQKLGSGVVRALSHTRVPDATSGFRAYSRDAALKLTVVTGFTYTLETLIQAAQKNLAIDHVPVRTNPRTRESRLFRGMGSYVRRSIATMLRVTVLYQPLRAFMALSGAFLLVSVVLFGRFLYFYFVTRPAPSGHVQSVVVAVALAIIGVLIAALGILSDLTAMNRRILEEILTNTRVTRFGSGSRAGRTRERRAHDGHAVAAGQPELAHPSALREGRGAP
jgi:glycosyltransferase involved in cell wall biosynthesis